MHYRMLVTLDAEADATSESVRDNVYQRLSHDASFCGDDGRFGSPLCDWFVIGGRWSGFLTEALLGEDYRRQLHALLPGLAEPFVPDSYFRENAEPLNRLWKDHGGTGPHPYLRDGYDELGEEDDARLLTRELFDAVLARYPVQSECRKGPSYYEYADLDGDRLTADFIGRKWLVVIDYHI